MRPLRICLVGPLPPPFGGMANQCRQLADLLRGDGHEVEVIQVNAPYKPAWIEEIKGMRAFFRLGPYLFRLWSAAGKADIFHIMANSGWSWHLFAAPAIWIAKWRGAAVVLNYRGGEAEEFFLRAFSWVRPSLNKSDAIMVPSGFLLQVFGKRGFDAWIVPNIVNLERFAPSISTNRSLPHILVARNLERLYDNSSALRAFALIRQRHPSAQMTLAGSGPERDALEQQAHDLGLADAVIFAGRVENSEMPNLYKTVSIALNPSLADNMPISILEALASGVPMVSTNVGGVPFLVEDEKTALLVPPGDHVAMANACLRLLEDASLADNLVMAGQKLACEFAWDRVRPKLYAVYNNVLDRRISATVER